MGRIFFGLVHNPFSTGMAKAADAQIALWTLRRLAKNPGLQAACAENLRQRMEARRLTATELFQFPLPVIKDVAGKVAIEPLAELAAKLGKGEYLPLWKKKRCYFEPLHAGTVKLLYLYYAIPQKSQSRFISVIKAKNPLLHELATATIAKNMLITWSGGTEDTLRSLGEIMVWFHVVNK